LYVVDRTTHKLVFQTPVTTISNPNNLTMPPREGVRLCPGYVGGVEWNGPAVELASRTIFVGAVDWCMTFQSGDAVYKPGSFYYGTGAAFGPRDSGSGWVTAIDADTGAIRWKHHTASPVVAAVTPTAGGIVLTGEGDNLFALDSSTGRELYTYDLGGSLGGGVITYTVGERQYVAVVAGNIARSGLGAHGIPTVTVLATGDTPAQPLTTKVTFDPFRDELAKMNPDARGSSLYARFCSTCHSSDGSGGIGPNLSAFRNSTTIAGVVKSPGSPMPKLYPAVLNDSDVKDVSDFVSRFGSVSR
jgi:alcohol dehydrogenase (cytochrome c)